MRRKIRSYAALFLGALLTSSSVLRAESRKTDSEQVSKLLSDAKSEALLLERDAEQLSAFTQSSVSWQSHADELSQIRSHVNKLGGIARLSVESSGSGITHFTMPFSVSQ